MVASSLNLMKANGSRYVDNDGMEAGEVYINFTSGDIVKHEFNLTGPAIPC